MAANQLKRDARDFRRLLNAQMEDGSNRQLNQFLENIPQRDPRGRRARTEDTRLQYAAFFLKRDELRNSNGTIKKTHDPIIQMLGMALKMTAQATYLSLLAKQDYVFQPELEPESENESEQESDAQRESDTQRESDAEQESDAKQECHAEQEAPKQQPDAASPKQQPDSASPKQEPEVDSLPEPIPVLQSLRRHHRSMTNRYELRLGFTTVKFVNTCSWNSIIHVLSGLYGEHGQVKALIDGLNEPNLLACTVKALCNDDIIDVAHDYRSRMMLQYFGDNGKGGVNCFENIFNVVEGVVGKALPSFTRKCACDLVGYSAHVPVDIITIRSDNVEASIRWDRVDKPCERCRQNCLVEFTDVIFFDVNAAFRIDVQKIQRVVNIRGNVYELAGFVDMETPPSQSKKPHYSGNCLIGNVWQQYNCWPKPTFGKSPVSVRPQTLVYIKRK